MFILSCFAVGCSGLVNNLVLPQGWSENHAALDGTRCTYVFKNSEYPVLEMIDGDLGTGNKAGHRIIVTLPTRKPIHRVVIRGTNIEDVIVYQGLGGQGHWKVVKQVKNNREPTLDLRVSAVTDRIRLQVGGTFDDQRMPGVPTPSGVMRGRQVKRANTLIHEIELYGLENKDDKKRENTERAEAVEEKTEPLEKQMEIESPTEEIEDFEEETPEF
jgi:hypothetical protein